MYKGRTVESLSEQSGYSASTLRRYIHQQLVNAPPELKLPQPTVYPIYLCIDGLWFGRLFCLMVYRLSNWPLIIHHSFTKKEWGAHIVKDLRYLKAQGYHFSGFVTDGGTGVTKAIDEVYPHAIHQRCLVHLHRQASKGVGKYPQDPQLKKLKELIDHLFLIESREALSWWVEQVLLWTRVNQDYLSETTHDAARGRWWFTHGKARSTVKILLTAPATSFMFVKGHPLMPRSTNEVEGLNALLTRRWLSHTGLANHRWKQLLNWFIYFRNLYYLSQIKQKQDI